MTDQVKDTVKNFVESLENDLTNLGIEVSENLLNRQGDILPFGLFKPELEGKLSWVCSYGEDGKSIISVFVMDQNSKTDKQVKQLKDEKEAIFYRDELIKDGWKILIPPKIVLTMKDKNGVSKPLNREQKRSLEKHLNMPDKKDKK